MKPPPSDSLLSAVPNDSHPLAVLGPRNVLDLARERGVLVLEDVLFLGGVPDTDLSRYIYRRI